MNIYKDNRELSWLKFNDRVLMQAKDDSVPLGERLTFISIFQTNLDEFFRVRMGFLFDQALFYPALKENKTNMTSSEQIKACERKVKYLYKKRDKIYASNLEMMKEYGVEIVRYDDIKDKEDKNSSNIISLRKCFLLYHHRLFQKDSHSLSLIMVNSILLPS